MVGDFFGQQAGEFHFILTPSMFPGGGYGATVHDNDGRAIIYQIIRESGSSQSEPQFPAGQSLENLATHEWGHSFVNPAVDLYSSRILRLGHLYRPVARRMNEQAYSNVTVFMYEQILRAATSLATEDFYGLDAMEAEIRSHEERGFYLTRATVEKLSEYRANRDLYPHFTDYLPELLDYMSEQRSSRNPLVVWLLPLVIGGIVGRLLLYRRAKVRTQSNPK